MGGEGDVGLGVCGERRRRRIPRGPVHGRPRRRAGLAGVERLSAAE